MDINLTFGWAWITLGFAAGGLLGLGFEREKWMGGYDSLRRRMLRLGHIAMVMLGLLNVLFALSAQAVSPRGDLVVVIRWLWVVGAVSMPLACGLMAWTPRCKPVFALPVSVLLAAGLLTAWLMTEGA